MAHHDHDRRSATGCAAAGWAGTERVRTVFDGYRDELRRLHEDWSEERLFVEASKFASPVAVAPHSTGGAVDLTICTEDGVELDMGTAGGIVDVFYATGNGAQVTEHDRVVGRR